MTQPETPTVTVRRATLEDKSAIFEFIRQAYWWRKEFKIPERWEWQFENNPFREDSRLPVWIAVDETGRVVGQTCATVERIKIGEGIYRIGWNSDAYLFPEYRGQRIGHRLEAAAAEAEKILMTLNPADAIRNILGSLGAVPTQPVHVLFRRLRYTPQGDFYWIRHQATPLEVRLRQAVTLGLRWLRLSRPAAFLLNLLTGRLRVRLPEIVDRGVQIEETAAFGSEVDALWEKISPDFRAVVKRDRDYLNWKFEQQPHMKHRKFIARRNGEPCGYLILRKAKPPESNFGMIVDLFASPRDEGAVQALAAFALRHFANQGVGYVLAATTVEAYRAQLVGLGFAIKDEWIPLATLKLPEADRRAALESGAWLLGKGDYDWNQFPGE